MSALTSSKALWYLTRGTGLVALVLLTLSVVLGVVQSVGWAHPRWPRFLTSGLHKNVSLLVTAFLGAHIVTAIGDSFAPIGWLDVVVPFVSRYRPIWLGLGAVAVDLLIALVITSLLRQRLGYRAWRVVHWTAYACWPIAFLHGLGTGSDPRVGWALGLQLACLIAVAGAVAWRLAAGWDRQDSSLRVLGLLWSTMGLAAIVLFAWQGPLRPGWARRAGTPVRLLAGASTSASGSTLATPGAASQATAPASKPASAPATPARPLTIPFTSSLAGSLTRTRASSGQEVVTITTTVANGTDAILRIVVRGAPLSGGGVEMQSSSASLGPPGQPEQFQGDIVSLAGSRLRLVLRDGASQEIDLAVGLQIDESSGTVSGTITAQPAGPGGDDG